VREKNGDPGAIRTRVRSQTNRLTPVGLLHSRPPVRRPLPPNFFPKLGRVMPERSFERGIVVTRARFERATPSFGGCSGNPVTYRCYFAIRKTWFGPVVP